LTDGLLSGQKLFKLEVVMKTKQNLDSKLLNFEKTFPKAKTKSLRPMRSLVATRSLKPMTVVATMNMKPETETRA